MERVAPKLLVVDDEVELAATVSDLAEEIGFSPSATSSPEEFKRLYDRDFDVIVLDLLMPEVDGIELLRFLAEADCEASIILMSGFDAHVLQARDRFGSTDRVQSGQDQVAGQRRLHRDLCGLLVADLAQ